MKLRRNLLVGGTLVCLASLAVLRWETVLLRRQLGERAAVQRRLESIAHELQNLRDRRTALRRNADGLRQQQDAARRIAAEAPVAEPSATAKAKLEVAQSRARITLQYELLYRALHLTGEQGAKLSGFLADFNATRADILASAKAEDLTQADPSIRKMLLRNATQLYQEISGVIGADGYQQWEEYQRTMPLHALAQNVASNLYYTSSPLTDAQQAQLVPMLQQLVANTPGTRGTSDYYAVNPTALEANARNVLSEAQVAALDTKFQQDQLNVQVAGLIATWQKEHSGQPVNNR